ncbi:alpha/beta fold hydrolase [Mycobacterium intracellulare]|uniref:alpha/beta fold hydrolase n=1 Tax=Mycobacterium intracellulare TaxID=1767 RepID=UPI00044B382E|nr:alpha/beta hydrolase fold family protein [Mycobacterium intracellulare MIN_061107_1834]BCO46878.1 putative hydrolase, alpha/beta hydrolase fold protein [Mycobacterium intracellulare]BCO62699.1 putative hydrolase, alpha/beta hydrolase fold protein [Mycobacterium intracellulare]BCO67993.1 putative hydrolase, alpha/beta hydrolase fold protein [Mycobacterium intracellulare]BCO73526.1 putative hydrolase, alpha/beta hydrolase fold protein [Mycobacterium intracellulare]
MAAVSKFEGTGMNICTLEDHRRYASTPSGPISYLDVGSGRPAVFIHGILANSLLWRHVIAAMAGDRRRCIVVDLPGHGHTPPAPANADVTLTGLARRVVELCEHLGLDRFDLVGNDTGGAVAQIVAAHVGRRLSTFTLTNCDTEGNTPPTLFKPVAVAARLGLLARIGPRVAASRRLKLSGLTAGCPHPGRLPAEVVDAYYDPVFGTPESSRAFARLVTAISSTDLDAVRSELSALMVPTLIVWGTGDVFFRLKWARRLADLIPGTVGITTVHGARMHFPDYRADEFIPALQQHWAQHSS